MRRLLLTTSASAHANKKQFAEAEAAFKKAIEIRPDNADAYTGLATVYNAQKKFDLAAEASANAAKYRPRPAARPAAAATPRRSTTRA